MSEFATIVERNNSAAHYVASQSEEFDGPVADLLLYNMAMAAERLPLPEFDGLSPVTRQQVDEVVRIASDIIPQEKDDLIRRDTESEEEFRVRTTLWQPINLLLDKVHTGDYDPKNKQEISKLRSAVASSAIAFASLIGETQGTREVSRFEPFFQRNADDVTSLVEQRQHVA